MENKNYPQYFLEQIYKVFKEEKLNSLANDLKEYLTIQGGAIESYRNKNFTRESKDKNIERNNPFIDDDKVESLNEKLLKLFFDIENCNSDLKLFTANLYLLRPTINNPTIEKINFSGVAHYTYYQNFSDWNYAALVSCCYEKLYNYWDRIGDVLALYLNLEIKEHKITFAYVIDYLDNKNLFSNNKNFIFLKEFREKEYKEFNNSRKDIVHYNQFETTYRYNFTIKHANNEEKIMELWKQKKNMPEYFKNHLELSVQGYKHCFKFVEEHFNNNP